MSMSFLLFNHYYDRGGEEKGEKGEKREEGEDMEEELTAIIITLGIDTIIYEEIIINHSTIIEPIPSFH